MLPVCAALLLSTLAGAHSTDVRGINNSTSNNGYGVFSSHAGGGQGVRGNRVTGNGVYGDSDKREKGPRFLERSAYVSGALWAGTNTLARLYFQRNA